MAVTASASGVWRATTPHELVSSPSATRTVPEARSRVRWVSRPEPPAVIEAATPLAIPSSTLTKPPPPRLKGATPASARVLKPAPAAADITEAAEARLEAIRMRHSIGLTPCAFAVWGTSIVISCRRAHQAPASSVAADGPFDQPASRITIPSNITKTRGQVDAERTVVRWGGGGGGLWSPAYRYVNKPAVHENRLDAALVVHGQCPCLGSFAVS